MTSLTTPSNVSPHTEVKVYKSNCHLYPQYSLFYQCNIILIQTYPPQCSYLHWITQHHLHPIQVHVATTTHKISLVSIYHNVKYFYQYYLLSEINTVPYVAKIIIWEILANGPHFSSPK